MKIPERMKAAVLVGPDRLEIREVSVPRPSYAEVLIRVEACALCKSDVGLIRKPWPGQPPYGEFIPGHEYSGFIVAVGEGVDEFSIGDRVAVEAHLGCGRCINCRRGDYTSCLNYGNRDKGHRANGFTTNGGYAQYVLNHINTVHRIPDNVSLEEASLLTNLGCVIYGIETLGGLLIGDRVVVLGPGAIGLIAVQVVKMLGAEWAWLVGTRRYRLDLGQKVGADRTILIPAADPVALVQEETHGLGADVVIDCSGSPEAPQLSIELVRRMGKILLIGFPHGKVAVDLSRLGQRNVHIFTVRGESRANCARAAKLLGLGCLNLHPLITHTFPLEHIEEAFHTFKTRDTLAMKVLIKPNEER